MKFVELGLRGVWLIEPEVFTDERGAFHRSFCAREFEQQSLVSTVVQGNVSENPHEGTLRGFHFQLPPFEEAKTISCLTGALFDIIVDLRPDSQTFMQWVSAEFSAANHRSLYIPAGCANAWLTTAPHTTVHYYMSELYSLSSYRGFRYNDPVFNFRWPSEPRIISEKDRNFLDFDPASLQKD
ncbi:MAG: dTDP-4-dehydrorhamnose 3,5-epimerase family protein [Deltaproteobacteria bacterium]|nr:dTDP-4-dehydrorhamnose 3,5-epimerase family protein [Deltaproteobacteria bacterium]